MAVVKADKFYMQLNAAELEAIIEKDSPSSNDRDAGFCSASSESEGGDDLLLENVHTICEDIRPSKEYGAAEEKSIVLVRNKRKSLEPSKVVESTSLLAASSCMTASGPLKKRIRYTSSADSAVVLTPPSFPSPSYINSNCNLPSTVDNVLNPSLSTPQAIIANPAHIFVRHPGVTTLHRAFGSGTQPEQQEPLALVAKLAQSNKAVTNGSSSIHESDEFKSLSTPLNETAIEELDDDTCKVNHNSSQTRPQQRNYKNMTRERRIEANARERTRVHTISAAYETLRRAVPAYASSQKLSKLSVLRVACSYILTLSRMAGKDYSSDHSEPTIADCIEAISTTIQTEGKIKRKKEE
ncbi:uncharacterized protein LOC132798518 [Drosophila nasuta]|uniref:Uncharacterized protein LOC117565352 n=1 Tax=Drosophila albomicans TaxID=7291 RepID=A0A6P8W9E8_DROAB|nr:uncharacterized protein LOC117565352 [Drosophila albomicans]XP_060666384.1 uncharacterized protein LOC132798518 [Drosophila nasuta]